MLAYALNPAVIFNSAIWGQTDSLFTLELFLGALLLFEGRIAFGWAMLMVAAITKPQALVFLPLLASWQGNWDRPERPIIAAATGLAVATILTLPFVEPLGLYEHYNKGAAYYAETSVNAFNLMAILGGFRQSDSAHAAVHELQGVGDGASWCSSSSTSPTSIYRRRDAEMYMYLMFLLPLGFFMLSTRMHERYLFPCLLFLTPLLPRRKHLWAFFVVLTVTYYLNLWYILRALNAEYFLAAYEPFGIAVSIVNVRAVRRRDGGGLPDDAARAGAAAAAVRRARRRRRCRSSRRGVAGARRSCRRTPRAVAQGVSDKRDKTRGRASARSRSRGRRSRSGRSRRAPRAIRSRGAIWRSRSCWS